MTSSKSASGCSTRTTTASAIWPLHRRCGNALEQAPPLKFYEAAAQAFGSNADELERIAELENEIARLEEAGETLANALAEQQQINAELQSRHGMAHGSSNAPFTFDWKNPDVALIWVLRRLFPPIKWTWPTIWTLAVAADIATTWIGLNSLATEAATPLPLLLLVWLRVVLFVAWGVSIYRYQGRDVLLVKSTVWLLIWWVVVLLAGGIDPPESTGEFAFTIQSKLLMFAPPFWWIPIRASYERAFPVGLVAMIWLYIALRLILSEFSTRFLLLLKRLREK